ncbi:MAG: YfhO family protein [Planctomycetaceae bacterium]|nr:YfhO family protein [Planctomycetaceae bacterium]
MNGRYLAMGNDFIPFYYNYKVYLLAHLANGHFPLWSPSEAAGFPFFSSPLTQSFYPFNLLLVAWYKLRGGYDPIDHQLFTLAGLSIFGLGLYYWLKQISASRLAVLFSVLVMTVSFRLTETMRFPNGIHTAAWYPWVLYALTALTTGENMKKAAWPCFVLFFSTICMCTAGYPYFLYYSIFLFVPYWILLLTPLCKQLTPATVLHRKRMFFLSVASGTAATLVCAPYLIAVKRLMSQTVNRAGTSWHHSTYYNFDFVDTIGSLIYPPLAQWEGWYFFSITGILLIALLLIVCVTSRKRTLPVGPMQERLSHWRLWTAVLVIWIAICSSISYGGESLLFKLLWHSLPGFSSLRVWGRFSIVLVPLIAWLLCIAYDMLEKFILREDISGRAAVKQRPLLFLLATTYFVVLTAQICLYRANLVDPYWKVWGQAFASHRITFIVFGFAAFTAVFMVVAASGYAARLRHWRALVFFVLFVVAAVEMWPVGTRAWSSLQTMSSKPQSIDIDSFYSKAFRNLRANRPGTATSSPVFGTGLSSPNWYFNNYVGFYHATEKDKKNQDILLGAVNGQKVFFSKSTKHPSIRSFLVDALGFSNPGQLVSYNGDVLVWKIDAPQDGYLSFIDNADPYWNVYVNGEKKRLERLFGTFKSVYLSKGTHRVEFRYEPTLKAILLGTDDETQADGTG